MSQTAITLAFEQWKASQSVTGEPVLLDEFVFASVPGLDATKPIDRNETLPPDAQIVHRQAVSRKGVVNENAVVHSVVLGADVGDFSFNWIGLINKASNTLAMIVHAPLQQKLKTKDGQQGNVLTRSFLMEFSGAQTETGINTPAETWQIDFTARMAGMDERQRLENIDIYGGAAFFGDGWLVGKTGNQFFVTKGVGYVAGLRATLAANQNVTITTKPAKVWLDVCWTGALTSDWAVQSKITVADDLTNYELNGIKHYVFALASIDESGVIKDLRPKGSLDSQQGSTDFMRKDMNLADVASPDEARKNLKLKSAAVMDVGTKAGTVAAGDDDRITGAVQRAGDQMAGQLTITDSTPLRFRQKDMSTLFRFDGSTFYLMFTKKGDPDGGYSDLRPFYVDANSGAITFGNSVKALAGITANSVKSNTSLFIESDDRQHIIFQNKDGTARAYIYKDRNSDLRLNNGNEGGGDFVISRTGEIFWGPNGARLSHDGNLYGSVWGGWLSNWINGQIGTRAEINWVQSNFVTDVALGAEGSFLIAKNAWQRAPAGCVLTGYNAEGNEPVNDTLFYRPIQKHIPSIGWINVGHTA